MMQAPSFAVTIATYSVSAYDPSNYRNRIVTSEAVHSLQMVKMRMDHIFGDCPDDYRKNRRPGTTGRELDAAVIGLDSAQAYEASKWMPREYNEFDRAELRRVMKTFTSDPALAEAPMAWALGREGSPALYVTAPEEVIEAVKTAFEAMSGSPDELHTSVNEPGIIDPQFRMLPQFPGLVTLRAWWD